MECNLAGELCNWVLAASYCVLCPGAWVVMGQKKEKAGLSLSGDQKLYFFWCAVCPRCPLSLATKEQLGLKEGFLQIFFVL